MKKNMFILLSVIALTLIACKSEPVRVACVGDSITYGHGIKDRLHDAYPGVLSSMLGEKYDVRRPMPIRSCWTIRRISPL